MGLRMNTSQSTIIIYLYTFREDHKDQETFLEKETSVCLTWMFFRISAPCSSKACQAQHTETEVYAQACEEAAVFSHFTC